jgi:penicillin amidase
MIGLSGPIDISFDDLGIPRITATTIPDAFYGQGYAAAVMRLWQMDIGHRRQLGRLAEAFGPDFVPFDIAARTMHFRGDLAQEWAALEPIVAEILRAFVAGINARVQEVRADPSLLPPEFRLLGILPEEWHANDTLIARFQSGQNAPAELRRAAAGCLEADALTAKLEPVWPLEIPEGLDPTLLHATDLALIERLAAKLPFETATGRTDLSQPPDDTTEGSNAWVIAGHLTDTGRPILANDPHLPFSVPAPRFTTHLRAPGLDVIGNGPPSRPGFQFGHTDRFAFGRTDFKIDQEDLYVLRLNDDATAYQTPDGWQPITRHTETIAVRGGEPATAVIATTPLGPIIAERPGVAITLRAASLLPGSPVGLEFVRLSLATDWASYRDAIRFAVWGSNYMYADTSGNIGWQCGGRAPRRRHHDGLMPVPAEGPYDWDGLIPIDELPNEYNPPRGWIASANQMPFPADYPINDRRVCFEYIIDDRYRRIVQVLSSRKQHTLTESVDLQHDTYSMRAEALQPLLNLITAPDLAETVATLQSWNRHVDADSHAAALYEFWSATLQSLLVLALVPEQAHGIITSIHPHIARDLLLAPDSRIDRETLLTEALRQAATAVAGRTWGEIHTVDLHHAVRGLKAADVTGLGSGGDGATVMARWWAGPANPNTTGGASFAAVMDVGNWNASLAINGPGQSGLPGDPHYADQYKDWIEGRYRPLPYTITPPADQ